MSKNQDLPKKEPAFNNSLLLPIIIAIAIIPLIVREYSYHSHLSKFLWYPADDSTFDYFLFYKSIFFIAISLIIVAILIHQYLVKKIPFKLNYIFIPLILYTLLALLSTLLSQNSYFGFHGIYEQFESIFVLLGYCLISYYTYLVIQTEDQINFLLKWWKYGIAILCLIGFTQFLGIDFFSSTYGKKLITPSSEWGNLNTLQFKFAKHTVYSTLYNPNYVGFYTALVAPIFLTLSFFAKNTKDRIINISLFFALLINMFGSGSRNGFICLGFSFLFMIIIFRSYLFKRWKIVVIGFLSIIIAFVATNALTNNLYINRLKQVVNIKSVEKPLKYIHTNKDNVNISYNKNDIFIKLNNDKMDTDPFTILDSNNNTLSYALQSDNTYLIKDDRFSNFRLTKDKIFDKNGFSVIFDNYKWVFSNEIGDGSYYYYNTAGKFVKIKTAKSSVFTNYESIAGRGYLWSRTIPLLKNNILIGSGADTFSTQFPQQDYVESYNNGFAGQIITKPHSMYLQIGVQTGVLSLIAFMVFYLLYFISSIKLYIKHPFNSFKSQIGVGIFIGTIGYMISAIANDSTITVAPVFWVLIGLGISINVSLNKEKVERSSKN